MSDRIDLLKHLLSNSKPEINSGLVGSGKFACSVCIEGYHRKYDSLDEVAQSVSDCALCVDVDFDLMQCDVELIFDGKDNIIARLDGESNNPGEPYYWVIDDEPDSINNYINLLNIKLIDELIDDWLKIASEPMTKGSSEFEFFLSYIKTHLELSLI